MAQLAWVCLAGAAGTGTRYLIGVWTTQRLGAHLPYGTLIVNLVGCFLISALAYASTPLGWSPQERTTVLVGFLGGLTTYSSFNYETLRLAQEGAVGLALVNFAITTAGGLLAGLAGVALARLLLS